MAQNSSNQQGSSNGQNIQPKPPIQISLGAEVKLRLRTGRRFSGRVTMVGINIPQIPEGAYLLHLHASKPEEPAYGILLWFPGTQNVSPGWRFNQLELKLFSQCEVVVV